MTALSATELLVAALALAGLAGLGWWLLPKLYRARGGIAGGTTGGEGLVGRWS